jgi:hypothetical protein
MLWKMVVWRALRDCVNEDAEIRTQAFIWTSRNSRDLHEVCDLADFNAEHVAKAGAVLHNLGCVRGKKWLDETRRKTK